MSGLVKSFFKLLKKPWQITGLTSTTDFIDYLPTATEYRRFAPGSQPVKAVIPHDAPQLVYSTRYYVRDFRRNNVYTTRAVDRTPLDVAKMMEAFPTTPETVTAIKFPEYVKDRGF